ncbi:ETC complex I subunit [Segnochrobactraceae bacterium EtOH-i3]
MVARIYKPAKTAMQSGRGKTHSWVLEFEQAMPRRIEPLMGWTGSGDMNQQVKLRFPTKDEAIAYAEREGIAYEVLESHERERKRVSYSDNFRFDRAQPWTH